MLTSKPAGPESGQTMQRVRVGLTGLAMVLILVGLASVLFSSANRDDPVSAVGAPSVETVANMTDTDAENAAAGKAEEPLAELGVAPSTAATEPVSAARIAQQLEAQRKAEAALEAEARRAEAAAQAE